MTQGAGQLSDFELQNLQDKHGNLVLKIAYIYLKDKYLAEDAYQETFLKVYKFLPRFDDEKLERMWITRVAINVCKDFYRKRWFKDSLKNKSIDDENNFGYIPQADPLEEPGQICVRSYEKKKIIDKVLNLPAIYKDAIILFYYNRYSTEEIAKIIGVSPQTIRKRLERARKLLKIEIEGSEILNEY